MPTNRTPIRPGSNRVITILSRSLFRQMKEQPAKCTCVIDDPTGCNQRMDCPACERWWKLHGDLCKDLKLKPWQFPAIVHPLDVHKLDALEALAPDEHLDKNVTPHHPAPWKGGRELYDELMRLAQ
jgi:hypothetical protein